MHTRLSCPYVPRPHRYADTGNQASFAGNGVAYFPSQGNDPTCTQPACNIKSICNVMTDASTGDEVQRLSVVAKKQAAWAREAKQARVARHITSRRAGRAAAGAAVGAPEVIPDFWGYQTCTEFAFYQTCEVGSGCFFTQGYNPPSPKQQHQQQ